LQTGKVARAGRGRWPLDVRVKVARVVVEDEVAARDAARRFGVPYTTVLQWADWYRRGGGQTAGTPVDVRVRARGAAAEARRAAILATKAAQPHAGSRRIRDVMQRFLGMGTSASTVQRVLKAEGTASARVRVKHKPERKEVRFERAEPNQLWQSDLFTFLLRRHERIYVAAFLDDHSRYLVSLAMAHHQRSTLVLEALARAIADYGAPREILTDQGRQYTAWRGSTEFEAELKRHGIAHVKSRPHHPQTCGKIERFWKTLWEELLARTVFADFEDCQRRVALFMQHYNFQRPHQALEGLTPADRFFRAASPVRAAIEATVRENALRLAREQPLRKPFYLIGRLGDRDLSISASGTALQVRVGDEQTTIPFSQESGHEEHTLSSRWRAEHRAAEAPAPPAAEVVEEFDRVARGGAQSLPDGAVGALGGALGERCDRVGEDLAQHVLPAGEARIERDTHGAAPALEVGGARSTAGADLSTRGTGPAPRAAEATQRAAPAPDAQVDARASDARAARPMAEATSRTEREPDAPWRELALRWERKLCAERATGRIGPEEYADEDAQAELHADSRRSARADAAAGGDHRSAGGPEDVVGSGPDARALAQSLPVDLASLATRDGADDHGEAGWTPGEAGAARDARARDATPEARERTSTGASSLDRATVGGGRGTAQGADPPDATRATRAQESGSER
jgi:transposase InsO family protein